MKNVILFACFCVVLIPYSGVGESLFRFQLYESFNDIYTLLPTIMMVPVSRPYYERAIQHQGAAQFTLGEHGQDNYFYNWYTNYYSKKVTYTIEEKHRSLGSSKRKPYSIIQNRKIIFQNRTTNIDLFYIPTAVIMREVTRDWWYQLDAELQAMITAREVPNLILDRTFILLTYPLMTISIQYCIKALRNVRDLRFFRADNDMTPNGRDIFLPYAVIRRKYQCNYTNGADGRSWKDKRKYFFLATTREAPGGSEDVRRWRTHLQRQFEKTKSELSKSILKQSIISRNLSLDGFNNGLLNSDFCFIIPGDTPSTAKLSKAIFSGCIPVIFVAFPSQLPFYSLLDWSKFSVVVYKDIIRMSVQKIDKLLEYLLTIRSNSTLLTRYKRNVRKVADYFDYGNWHYPSVYHLALLTLQDSLIRDDQVIVPL